MAQNIVKRVASVFIEDGQAVKSLKGLTAESRKLYNELASLPRGSEAFIAKTKEFQRIQRDIRGIKDEVNGTGGVFKKLTGMLGPLGAGVAGMFAVDAVVGWGKEAVNAFREAEKASAKVEQAIISTNGAAGVSFDEIKAKAEELQGITLFDDDTILNKASAQLLTFTNIAEENFFKAQTAALDLATVLDGDLQSASIMVGKALNDPIKGLTAMGKAGIQFSEDQKETIKTLVETNRLADAQSIILGELQVQYGGQAVAAAKADGGVTQLANAWGDFQEQVGGALVEVFNMEGGTDLLRTGIGYLSEGLTWLVEKLGEAKEWFVQLYDGSALLRTGLQYTTTVIKTAWEAVVLSFKVGFEAITTPIKAIGQLLTGDLSGAFETVKEGIGNVFNAVKDAAVNTIGNVKDAVNEVTDPKMFKGVEDAAAQTKPVIKVAVEVDEEGLDGEAALGKVRDAINKGYDDIRRSRMTAQQREMDDVRKKYDDLVLEANGHAEEVRMIEELRAEELSSIRSKYGQKEIERLQKLDDDINGVLEEQRMAKLSKDEREVEAINAKFAKLEESAKGHSDRLYLIEEMRIAAIEGLQQERAEREQEARDAWDEAVEEQRMSQVEGQLAAMDERHMAELEMAQTHGIALDELYARQQEERSALVMELREAELESINEHFEALYEQADLNGLDTTEMQRLHGEAIAMMKQQHAQQDVALRVETDAKLLDSQRKRAEAERMVMTSIMEVTKEIFIAAGADADEMNTFNKLSTLFQIGMDTAAAISSLTAMSEANPANAVTGGGAAIIQFLTGFARIGMNIAKATSLLSKPKPTVPEFYVGGGTETAMMNYHNPGTGPVSITMAPTVSQGGTVNHKTLGWFGERGPEWVAPNWMYQHPDMQPLFQHLEYVRTTGAMPAFEVGGPTGSTGSVQAPMGMVDQASPVMIAVANALNALTGQLQQPLTALVNNDQLEDNSERLTTIRNESQLR